jgi:hypothetical protein
LTKLITDDAVAQHRHKISDVTHQPTELIGGMQETMECRSSAKDMQTQLHGEVQGTCLIFLQLEVMWCERAQRRVGGATAKLELVRQNSSRTQDPNKQSTKPLVVSLGSVRVRRLCVRQTVHLGTAGSGKAPSS